MSSKIQALPLPQRPAKLRLAGPLAILATLVVAAGVAGLLALRQGEPASGPTAANERSSVIAGKGPAIQDLAGRYAAPKSLGGISDTAPALAEIRGVDVIAIRPSSIWPSEAALERGFDGAAIASANFPSVAAMERQFGSIASANFPSVAAMERWFSSSSVPDNCRLVRHGPC